MSTEENIKYNTTEELEEIWTERFQVWMDKARQAPDKNEEYKQQQKVYSMFAQAYDDAIALEKYSGYYKIAEKIDSLFIKNQDKHIKILDYGCGTGLVADALKKHGFYNIAGVDCNNELLDIAKQKNIMNAYILGKNTESLKDIPSNTYDVVCSAGVFFLSSTHPGTECFEEICRVIKPNGWFIVLTKNAYLDYEYVHMEVVEKLEQQGILKCYSKELYQGYRETYDYEEDRKSMAVILTYKVM